MSSEAMDKGGAEENAPETPDIPPGGMMPYDLRDGVLTTYHYPLPYPENVGRTGRTSFAANVAICLAALAAVHHFVPPPPEWPAWRTYLLIAVLAVALPLFDALGRRRRAKRGTPRVKKSADLTGVAFDSRTGEVFRTTGSGKRKPAARFADIAEVRLYREKSPFSHNYYYVAVRKDPFQKGIRVSHITTKLDELKCYGETILPWLEKALAEWPAAEADGEGAGERRDRAAGGEERFFPFDGREYARTLVLEPAILAVVALGLVCWLSLASYGYAGTAVLGLALLATLVALLYEPVRISFEPAGGTVRVVSFFGLRRDEFPFSEIQSLTIKNVGALHIAGLNAEGRMPCDLLVAFGADKARRAVRECAGVAGLDPGKIVVVC